MISRKSVRCIRHAKTLIEIGRGREALEILGRLKPHEHESEPVTALRVEALLAAGQEAPAVSLAQDLVDEIQCHPGRVAAAHIALCVLSSHFSRTRRLDRAVQYARAAAVLEAAPDSQAMADSLNRALWLAIMDAHQRTKSSGS